MEDTIKNLEQTIDNLKNKTNKYYIFVQDTKGNPRASVKYLYDLGMTLKKLGNNVIILHEKENYTGVSEWLGEEYMKELQHLPIEGKSLEVSPADFLLVPELFGYVLEQVKDLPCTKIVICQSYDYMLETYNPGFSWTSYGVHKCITTSEIQKEYIKGVVRNTNIDILEPTISDIFKPSNEPPKPIVAIHTRDPRTTMTIIKTFYLKYPQFRWVTFRDMRGLSQVEFSNNLRDAMISVWVDDISGYGTFPLESMKSNVPVLGKIPNLIPYWMNDNNGFWSDNILSIINFIAEYIHGWLEDNIKYEVFDAMKETVESLPTKEDFENKVSELFNSYVENRIETFENKLNSLKEV